MKRLKTIIPVAGIWLLILSAASLYVAMQALSDIRPAEDYEDIGVLTFQPYDVLPVQVQNTGASSRDRRMNPTKTVYMVYYRATDGSGYKWSNEAFSKDHGQRVVEAGETVERRVLRIPADGTYITVEPDQTAGSYTEGLRQKCTTVLVLAGAYVLLYGLGWCVLIFTKKAKRGSQVWYNRKGNYKRGPRLPYQFCSCSVRWQAVGISRRRMRPARTGRQIHTRPR